MKIIVRFACLVSILFAAIPAVSGDAQTAKEAAVAAVDAHRPELVELADQVWAFAETALRETRSAAVLADYAEAHGFEVERGVAGMPTAFVASYGEGRPIIGILGEYDALPGISQRAQATPEPLVPGAAGHGCGHNLLGTAGSGAALAIKELIAAGEISGTMRFYGTPAEEAVGGKLYMVRDGLFDDLDVALAWHPRDEVVADTKGNQAVVDFVVEFEGQTAHAAYDPWNGRSAADGAEVFTFALNLMREHVPTDRPHALRGHRRGRCPQRGARPCPGLVLVAGLEPRRRRPAARARTADRRGCGACHRHHRPSHRPVRDWEMLLTMAGATLIHDNMMWLGPIEFSEEEQEFARQIQRATDVEPVGLKGVPEAARPRPARDRRRFDGCRRCELEGADPPLFGDHGGRSARRGTRGRWWRPEACRSATRA